MWSVLAQVPVLPDSLFGTGALAGVITFVLTAWLKRWWVTGKEHEELKQEAAKRLEEERNRAEAEIDRSRREIDYWRGIAMTNLGMAEKAVSLAEGTRP